MKKLTLLLTISLCGCSTTADWGKYRGVPHSHEPISNSRLTEELLSPEEESRLKGEANRLGLRYVDYLHGVNSNKIRRNPTFFYQAYDDKWNDPSINPVFDTRVEAEKYAKENNMGNNHSYVVREVNYRYVVRVGFSDYTYSNGSWNDILHTSLKFNDAYEYVVEYSSSHSDLIIYDLKTGKTFEETP